MDQLVDKITHARVSMLFRQPFWGTLATRLIVKDVSDQGWCSTAATDGRYFYYNAQWLNKLNKDELVFLFAHEVQHVVYSHMTRRGGRLPKLWNAACDYCINWELQEHKVGTMPSDKTGVIGLIDEKYANMSAEEIYELLLEDPDADFPEFDVHMDPTMTEDEMTQLQSEMRSAVLEAAKAAGAGNVPKNIQRMIKDLTEPEMDWREILNAAAQSTIKHDYTWTRQAKKTVYSSIYLPGMNRDVRLSAAAAIDTSGSMSEGMLKDLLSEIKGIMEQFSDFELKVWCFDTSVHNYKTFTPDNIEDINSYELMGGGGTEFMCNWDFMMENEISPDQFVMFTDGYNNSRQWGIEEYCDTIFLIHSDPNRTITSPFGTTLYYTADSQKS